MYERILIPVDLAHTDKLGKALATAADLAKHYRASICCVGVTAAAPTHVANNPEEYAEELNRFAADQSKRRGVEFEPKMMVSHDPVSDLDDVLGEAIKEQSADLVVMASHVPTFADYFISSNAGYLASHVSTSVFVVR
jgi:nucleotide-binding universal stress UspA family protein